MKNIKYGLIEEIYSFGASTRTTYGIAVYANPENDGTSTIIASVHDITASKDTLYTLVSQCNDLDLSLIHLYDVVEDFLATK